MCARAAQAGNLARKRCTSVGELRRLLGHAQVRGVLEHLELRARDALGDRLRHRERRADVARAGDDQGRAGGPSSTIEPVDGADALARRRHSRPGRSAAAWRAARAPQRLRGAEVGVQVALHDHVGDRRHAALLDRRDPRRPAPAAPPRDNARVVLASTSAAHAAPDGESRAPARPCRPSTGR